MKYLFSAIAFFLITITAEAQVTLNLESGLYLISIEDVSDGGEGDIISYPDDLGIRQLPNIRAGLSWQTNRHILYGKAVIFQFSKTAEFTEPKAYEGYVFPAGVPIDVDYKFNGYRIGYTYQFLDEEQFAAGAGITLNIRQGLIRFADDQESREFSKDPVPLVPLINYFSTYMPEAWFSLHGEAEFFYFTPNGWVFDMLLSANFHPASWLSIYAGYRGFAGNGYSEGRFGNRLYTHTLAAGINFRINY